MRVLLLLAVVWFLSTCRSSASPELPPDFEWTTWSNVAAGYSLEVPEVYAADVEDGGNAVYFRWGRTVPVKVYLTDLESAKGHGLWVNEEPTGTTTLAGLAATRYDYTHCDGPFCSRIASFVLEREDRWLALEFRSHGELDSVNQRIHSSFALLEAGDAD